MLQNSHEEHFSHQSTSVVAALVTVPSRGATTQHHGYEKEAPPSHFAGPKLPAASAVQSAQQYRHIPTKDSNILRLFRIQKVKEESKLPLLYSNRALQVTTQTATHPLTRPCRHPCIPQAHVPSGAFSHFISLVGDSDFFANFLVFPKISKLLKPCSLPYDVIITSFSRGSHMAWTPCKPVVHIH